MTSPPDPIASTAIDLVHADGRRVRGRIWIGNPYQVDEHEAKCPCGIDGLDGRLADISGSDTLQALMLAARLLANRLSDFNEKGGRIVHPGSDEAFDLEPVFGSWVEERERT